MTAIAAPGSLCIRAARPDDAAAILHLEALFPSDRMSARSVRRFLASPSARVLVAQSANESANESGKEILGNLVLLLRASSPKARIYSLVVSPAARGSGIGRLLVQAAHDEARRSGRSTMTLEVRADALAARALYQQLGYGVERELIGYYDDGADGLRLVRPL